VKIRIAIAIATGALISLLFYVFDAALHGTPIQFLVLPGHVAIVLIWGAHAMDPNSLPIAVMLGTAVNTTAYGLIAFGLLEWLRRSDKSRSP
jgi:hypothetical protein